MANFFFFDKAKNRIFQTYPAIFRTDTEQGANHNRLTKYGWYNVLYMAADGNLKTMKLLEESKVDEVMTLINYKIDYQKEHFKK